MGVDTAGGDDPSRRIDLARGSRQALRERDDAAARDADIGVEGVGGGGDARVAHDEIEGGHGLAFALCRPGSALWRGRARLWVAYRSEDAPRLALECGADHLDRPHAAGQYVGST